jgi:hypothetical protein
MKKSINSHCHLRSVGRGVGGSCGGIGFRPTSRALVGWSGVRWVGNLIPREFTGWVRERQSAAVVNPQTGGWRGGSISKCCPRPTSCGQSAQHHVIDCPGENGVLNDTCRCLLFGGRLQS